MGTAVVGPSARGRLERARRWLGERGPDEELLVVAASADAASELLRSATLRSERGASFGWHRATPGRLAAELARTALIELERVPVSRLGVEAVVARVVHERAREGLLGRYAAVWDRPGFATALAAALEDLRLAAVESEALGEVEPELRGLERSYASALEAAGLADRGLRRTRGSSWRGHGRPRRRSQAPRLASLDWRAIRSWRGRCVRRVAGSS